MKPTSFIHWSTCSNSCKIRKAALRGLWTSEVSRQEKTTLIIRNPVLG
jgi:hypothetical protein